MGPQNGATSEHSAHGKVVQTYVPSAERAKQEDEHQRTRFRFALMRTVSVHMDSAVFKGETLQYQTVHYISARGHVEQSQGTQGWVQYSIRDGGGSGQLI